MCRARLWPSAPWLRSCSSTRPVCAIMTQWIIHTQKPQLNLSQIFLTVSSNVSGAGISFSAKYDNCEYFVCLFSKHYKGLPPQTHHHRPLALCIVSTMTVEFCFFVCAFVFFFRGRGSVKHIFHQVAMCASCLVALYLWRTFSGIIFESTRKKWKWSRK